MKLETTSLDDSRRRDQTGEAEGINHSFATGAEEGVDRDGIDVLN